MKDVYEVAGISRQALHQKLAANHRQHITKQKLFEQADKLRKSHPGCGCRKLAEEMVCPGWGRDKIEALLLDNGYRQCCPPNYVKTTRSGHYRCSNLIEGLKLQAVNKVMQTDITYVPLKGGHCYVTFIIDVYSRRITGFASSINLEATANIEALEMMLETRKGSCLKGMIHHSDRGSQFSQIDYRQLLADNNIKMSMCAYPWENAYSERINRTIKEEYLQKWSIEDHHQLNNAVKKAVYHYNHYRKHNSIGKMSPVDFEKHVRTLPANKRPTVEIYKNKREFNQF